MNTTQAYLKGRRTRRRHSAEFKASLVEACNKPGVSIAAIALSHGVNANLLRRWIVNAEAGDRTCMPDVVPAQVEPVTKHEAFIAVATAPALDVAPIRVEIRRGATCVMVAWPITASVECAAWLREVLR